jgi:hypothetical protein
MAESGLETVLETFRDALRAQKELADRALGQLQDDDWHALIDSEANSVAVIVRHMAGNMRSRWTDFLHSDGEKPDRDRDGEFSRVAASPEALRQEWEDGWRTTFAALDVLAPDDLLRTVTIRGERMSAVGAIVRQLDHYGQHVGQILLLAKHLRGGGWQPLSRPAKRRS